MPSPDKIRIPYENFDGGRFNCVGKCLNGSQFMAFVTGAFPGKVHYPDLKSDWRIKKSWNAVLHRFDADGNHVNTEVKRGGFDIEGREACEKAEIHFKEMVTELMSQKAMPCDIFVKLFPVVIDEVIYGLEYSYEIDEDDGYEIESVNLWPNDIMFHPPWNSGEYST